MLHTQYGVVAYCREKACLERTLDTFERDHPEVRVVRERKVG